MAKKKPAAQKSTPDDSIPKFEESLAELQEIVDALEDGTLGLEESMQRFERGVGLLRGCFQVLEQAEQRIEVLTGFDKQGNPLTAEFDASATADQSKPAAGRRSRRATKKKNDSSETSDQTDEDEEDAGQTLF